MNDEWSRCPICFEDYSTIHRPTTFGCGHSICIDHVTGFQQLRNCPICRHTLRQSNEYHVSYSLEEAARLFQLIKAKIDWSTIIVSSVIDPNVPRDSTLETIHRDEVYARRLQAELNRGNVAEPQHRPEVARRNQAAPAERINRPADTVKTCGHGCDLVSTDQCCTCSDRRPHPRNGRYDTYVDGVGIVNRAPRNEFYCSTCKKQ